VTWFKVDDGLHSSKPVLRIPRRYRAPAVGLWILAGTWSAQEELDGFVPDFVLEELCGTTALAQQLVRVGLWEVALGNSDDLHLPLDKSLGVSGVPGWRFKNWAKYQPTRAELAEIREKERVRKANYRASRRDTDGTPDGLPEGHQGVSQPSRPGPSRPDPTTGPRPLESSTEGDREGPEIDLTKVKSAVQKHCGRECSDTDAYRVIGTILSRAKSEPKSPTAFVTGAIARDPFEFQKLIDDAEAA